MSFFEVENFEHLITTSGQLIGYITLFGIIFAETGLLIGFFLPGDSLLVTAGILAGRGFLDIWVLCVILFAAAVLGDSVGYAIGHKFGKRLFKRDDSLLFHKDHLVRSKKFYDQHGGKTIILARFMPVIRTFAPVVAGMAEMPYSQFLMYNVAGGLIWAVGLPVLGYFLGKSLPNVDAYLLPLIGVIVLTSIAPAIYHSLNTKAKRHNVLTTVKKLLNKKQ